MSASEVANMTAPPTPWAPRARFSISADEETPHRSDDTENTPEPDGEHHPASEHVAEDPGGEEEGRQGQRVGVDHPLEIAEARVQRALDVGEGDVHHRDVEKEHERRRAHGDEGPPLALECRARRAHFPEITIQVGSYLIHRRRRQADRRSPDGSLDEVHDRGPPTRGTSR